MGKTIRIKAQHPGPDVALYYTLDVLKKPARRKDWDVWGVCEHEGSFWVGYQASVGGNKVRQLPLLEVLDRKDEEYPEWEDEEIYLIVRANGTGAFEWFLLNKDEFDRAEAHYKRCS